MLIFRDRGSIFHYSVVVWVGDGASTLFWTDRWLDDQSIAELSP
jgi:hypothetical protein